MRSRLLRLVSGWTRRAGRGPWPVWAVLGMVVFLAAVSPAHAAVTKITFWYSLGGASGELFRKMVDDFNRTHPEIQVDPVFTGSYADTATKTIAALAANTLPEGGVIPAAPLFTGRAGNYKILEFITGPDGLDMDDFFPVFWEYNKYRGKIASLPFNNSTPVLYYNKDLLKQAGLDPNRPPATWEEMVQAAQKAIPSGGWGVVMDNPDWSLKALILQSGGRIMNDDSSAPAFNSPEGVEAMRFVKRLVDEKLMPVWLHNRARDQFKSGRAVFMYGTTGAVGDVMDAVRFEWGTAFLPANRRYGVTVGGAALALFPSTPEKERATWTFLRWLLTPDNVVRWSIGTGYVPVRKSVATSSTLQEFFRQKPQYRAGYEQLVYAQTYQHFWEMGAMDNFLREAMEKVERGVATPEAALAEADQRLREEMGI